MSEVKISVSIPYRRRADNLRIVLEGLATQTMNPSEYEVVVGAMEYSHEYLDLCIDFVDRLNLVSVLSPRVFETPRARNLAMRQATGRVVVQMDADTLLPRWALQNLYERHYAFGQNVCVVGQVVGYGNNSDGNVESVEVQPYSHYAEVLNEIAAASDAPKDPRFRVAHVIPWAFAWTGLIALPMATVRKHDLFFDEDFHGWGAEDLEWGYRISATGTPIVLRDDVLALHLPHARDMAANRITERENYRRILRKWPGLDVELANAFGDFDANCLYLDFMTQVQAASEPNHMLGSVLGAKEGKRILYLGVPLDEEGRVADLNMKSRLDSMRDVEIWPLVGLALPFEDKIFDECRVNAVLTKFSKAYWDAVQDEAQRVAKSIFLVNSDDG